jgi:hypothetical protein
VNYDNSILAGHFGDNWDLSSITMGHTYLSDGDGEVYGLGMEYYGKVRVSLMIMKLLSEEKKLLEASERCEACGHLEALHNYHCCEFCTVPGCRCEYGEVEPEPEEEIELEEAKVWPENVCYWCGEGFREKEVYSVYGFMPRYTYVHKTRECGGSKDGKFLHPWRFDEIAGERIPD